MKRAVVFIFLIAAGCVPFPRGTAAANKVFAKATPMCTILATPQAYIGRRVLISGTYFVSPHGPGFYDESCSGAIGLDYESRLQTSQHDDRGALSAIRAATAGDVRQAVPIVLEGFLIGPSATAAEPATLYCSFAAPCSEYRLQDWRIVAAGAALKRTDL